MPVRIRGKFLTEAQITDIKLILSCHPNAGRVALSRLICAHFDWKQPNGNFQDMACREILLRLEKQGWIILPRRKKKGRPNSQVPLLELPLEEQHEPLLGRLGNFPGVRMAMVIGEKESCHWNALIHRYHYLGYKPMVGRALKYWIYLGDHKVGLIGWGSPCWKLACRDNFVGWDVVTREKNLQGIANNTRFLIFPWVKVKYLASHVLSLAARRVPGDWWKRYGVELSLFETFVDASRYKGTCYKAANWIYLGQSKGASKSGNSYHWHGQVKDVYVYPLSAFFRQRLMVVKG